MSAGTVKQGLMVNMTNKYVMVYSIGTVVWFLLFRNVWDERGTLSPKTVRRLLRESMLKLTSA